MYLRPKTTLQAVNLVGNPFCQETDYRSYVLAHLKHLKYLDYRLVDEQAVTIAREAYQDELLDMEETEGQEEAAKVLAEEKAEKTKVLLAANLKGIDTLFDDLMVKPDGEMARLRSMQAFVEPLSSLREVVNEATDEYVTAALAQAEVKKCERDMFESALAKAKAEAAAESKDEIAKYQGLQKRSLLGMREEGAEHPHAVLQMLHKANDALYEKLLDMEMSQSERYAESIKAFESAYDDLVKRTLEGTGAFFGRLRDFEAEYHEKLLSAAAEVLERVIGSDIDAFPEEARALLADKDTIMTAVNGAHDQRVAKLDAKEDELRSAEEKALASLMKGVVDEEYLRNRTRVIEVWKLVNEVHKKELESDRFDD